MDSIWRPCPNARDGFYESIDYFFQMIQCVFTVALDEVICGNGSQGFSGE